MSNQAFERRLAKWGGPRFAEATAQQIRFWTIGLMLSDRGYAKNVSFLSKRFSRASDSLAT